MIFILSLRMCKGASKQSPNSKNLTRRDRAPRSENPGSATITCMDFIMYEER